MRIFNKKIVATLIVALIVSQLGFVYAKEWKAEELSEDQQKAFITRDEFTTWVIAFTASLSEVDKNATQKIFDNMDFYDLQYKITIVYDYDENNANWYTTSGIERPEGWYYPTSRTSGLQKSKEQQLEDFRNDAVAWEKYRRGLITSLPHGTEAEMKTWQKNENNVSYEFSETKK